MAASCTPCSIFLHQLLSIFNTVGQINSPLNHHIYFLIGPSLVPLTVKNVPAMQETWIQSLGQEDPLEKGMATHSSIPAWRIPRDREAWWAIAHGVAKSWIQLSPSHFIL